MSFWNKLENLRNKPESARQVIAAILTIILTAIIITVWLFLKTIPAPQTIPTDTITPFKILGNYISDLWK